MKYRFSFFIDGVLWFVLYELSKEYCLSCRETGVLIINIVFDFIVFLFCHCLSLLYYISLFINKLCNNIQTIGIVISIITYMILFVISFFLQFVGITSFVIPQRELGIIDALLLVVMSFLFFVLSLLIRIIIYKKHKIQLK